MQILYYNVADPVYIINHTRNHINANHVLQELLLCHIDYQR